MTSKSSVSRAVAILIAAVGFFVSVPGDVLPAPVITYRTLGRHAEWVKSVAFSPDGKTVASGGGLDQTVKLWDVRTERLMRTLQAGSLVHSVAFSLDSQLIAGNGPDSTVQLWNIRTGQVRLVLRGHDSWMTVVAFSPDGKTVATGGSDGTVRIWDVRTSSVKRVLRAHRWVMSIAFSPDGQTLASCTTAEEDLGVKLWDVETGGLLRRLDSGPKGSLRTVAYSPNGRWIAAGGIYGGTLKIMTLSLWDVRTGRLVWEDNPIDLLDSIAFSPDSRLLATAGSGWAARLWDVRTGRLAHVLKNPGVRSVSFSTDGNQLAGAVDELVVLWDVRVFKRLRG